MKNSQKGFFELIGGLALIALGVILVGLNTTVRFSFYTAYIHGYAVSSSLLIVPLLVSIVMIIVMDNNLPGEILFWLSLLAILVSIIAGTEFRLNSTSLLNMVIMFAPIAIGAGLALKGLINDKKQN